MRLNRKPVSIKGIISLFFILSMLLSIASISYLIFRNWLSSSEQITKSISSDLADTIFNEIDSFIDVPIHINDANQKIIESGILDLSDDNHRDKFFTGVLKSQDSMIYSFSYGTAAGEYYGARRDENGVVQIMRNNAQTGGNSWYYFVKDDLSAGELAVKAGPFDPRTRAWYQAAAKAGGPVFSPIYKHFIMDDLTISAAWPVYDKSGELRGVMGTHMLLSDISSFLVNNINQYGGYALIVEQDSGDIIGNSIGKDNFTLLADGTFNRFHISALENVEIQQAYALFQDHHASSFVHQGKDQKYFVSTREILRDGLDWVIISAIPDGHYMRSVEKSILITLFLITLALLFSWIVFRSVAGRLLKPLNHLLEVSAAISSGNLSNRVKIVRKDEIGRISESMNQVADKMQFHINNLETSVHERTEELHQANQALQENKNQLQLILDSTAEAIFGIDIHGKCTFCNVSCLRLLGYKRQDELLGENMHLKVHYKKRDGSPFPIEECRIFQSIQLARGFEADDEVFWKADGSPIDVEYHAYPQILEGKVIGGVITFMDITNRKKREEQIRFLSCHDPLTGLYNRHCLEENLKIFDTNSNLPLSVIFGDLNGLKMTNDIFGHNAGDELIRKSAEILKQSCREQDIVARVGGDEFIILLPKTSREKTENVISRIRAGFADARIEAIKCSISLGNDTKYEEDQSLEEIIANAENAMYKDKTLNRKSINKDIVDTIIETLHTRSERERMHSIKVSELCAEIGSRLNLSKADIAVLSRVGFLHDIGKITLNHDILTKKTLTDQDYAEIQQHSATGFRILNLFDDTLDLAEYTYNHHERWDGKGYPRGIKGDQIPLISRIIAVTETYDRVVNRQTIPEELRQETAVETIRKNAGTQFDPEVASAFVQMICEKRSGKYSRTKQFRCIE